MHRHRRSRSPRRSRRTVLQPAATHREKPKAKLVAVVIKPKAKLVAPAPPTCKAEEDASDQDWGNWQRREAPPPSHAKVKMEWWEQEVLTPSDSEAEPPPWRRNMADGKKPPVPRMAKRPVWTPHPLATGASSSSRLTAAPVVEPSAQARRPRMQPKKRVRERDKQRRKAHVARRHATAACLQRTAKDKNLAKMLMQGLAVQHPMGQTKGRQ